MNILRIAAITFQWVLTALQP